MVISMVVISKWLNSESGGGERKLSTIFSKYFSKGMMVNSQQPNKISTFKIVWKFVKSYNLKFCLRNRGVNHPHLEDLKASSRKWFNIIKC